MEARTTQFHRAPNIGPEIGSEPAVEAVLVVDVDGYEGPLDVLLTLARDQKVDLRHISILKLADQYLTFIAGADRANLELAACYLVMAAWLADLKSRLLLPEPKVEGEATGEAMAEALAFQLRRLEAMRMAGERLIARPRLGRDVFARGEPEQFEPEMVTVVQVTLFDLLRGYSAHLSQRRQTVLRVEASELTSVETALEWVRRSLGSIPRWETLAALLPASARDALATGRLSGRSALAATFTACLELAKAGDVTLHQAAPFGPILISRADEMNTAGADGSNAVGAPDPTRKP